MVSLRLALFSGASYLFFLAGPITLVPVYLLAQDPRHLMYLNLFLHYMIIAFVKD